VEAAPAPDQLAHAGDRPQPEAPGEAADTEPAVRAGFGYRFAPNRERRIEP
jgi:hypothetical protein